MVESEATALHQELLAAIRDPQLRGEMKQLLDLCVTAVDDLRRIEEHLYCLYLESGEDLAHMVGACAILEGLAAPALDGLRRLSEHLNRQGFMAAPEPADDDVDFDFDLFTPAVSEGLRDTGGAGGLKEDDIDGVIDVLSPPKQRSVQEKNDAVRGEVDAVGYGLRSQLAGFDQRFGEVCQRGNLHQALRELDDLRNSTTDGIVALVSTVCETYLGRFDRAQVLPGHRNALEQAILVRRGIAELRRKVNACNSRIQEKGSERQLQEYAFQTMQAVLGDFLRSEVFEAMRPADRYELDKFFTQVSEGSVSASRLVCEGCAKYLDSLAVINLRDVLRQHDRQLALEVSELLESAAPLLEVSPRVAAQLVRDAFGRVDELFGRQEALDLLIVAWRSAPPDMTVAAQIQVAIDKLSAQLKLID